MRPDTSVAIHLEDYAPTPYEVETVELDIRLFPEATEVTSRLRIKPRAGTALGTPLLLDGDDLTFKGLRLDGEEIHELGFEVSASQLTLKAPPVEPFVLEIDTEINPTANTELSGLYRSSATYCTQCEAEGFRRITYFPDRPDVLAVYTTRIEGPVADCPVLLGNGNLLDAGSIPESDRHFAIWHDPHPKPSYLFAMVAGDLAHVADDFTTASGRKVALKIYVEHGNEGKCDWAMDSLKRSMKWDEDVFGCEYDLDVFNIVAVSDFNMGAMENKGLNIFNDKYVLADADTATDQDFANIEAVIAHEYFHNWTGNRITCRDWFQLCLKEGLTVFRDQEFSSDMRSRPVKRIADVRLLKSHQFPEDAGPLAHPVRPRKYTEINNFYTATVYEKGAEVVRMLKTILGADGFKKGMDLYFARHDGDATTIEAFLACFAEATGEDLSHFALWYEQAGTPHVEATSEYNASENTLTLRLHQSIPPLPSQETSRPLLLPIRFGLIGKSGKELTPESVSGAKLVGDVIWFDSEDQKITFTGITEEPVLSLLREFSAPVTLNAHQDTTDLIFLAKNDSDPFNRWQSLQTLATKEMIRLSQELRSGTTPSVTEDLVAVFGEVLEDQSLDPAFRALAMQLPGEGDLAREIGQNVDPEAIHKARALLRLEIATTHLDAMTRLAKARPTGAYDPGAADAGQRALANQALSYLAATRSAEASEFIWTLFAQADNMTDRIAALSLLVHDDLPQAEAALEAYRRRYETVALAMDKWFMVQATASVPDGLERVKALTAHPQFEFSNPNRVRSLIHAFASGNLSQFARADGQGFSFIIDNVLTLDARNAQVASRLMTSFRSWRALEPQRKELAKTELLRLSSCENLSRDTRDIVDRCLQ